VPLSGSIKAANGAALPTETRQTVPLSLEIRRHNLPTLQEVKINPQEKPLQEPAINLQGFALFWESYPNKMNRPRAQTCFLMLKQTDLLSDVLEGLNRWKSSEKWQSEPKFIPYPAKFLEQRQWEDNPPANGETQNERRVRKSIQESAEILNELERERNGNSDYELGDTPRPALQPKRNYVATGKKDLPEGAIQIFRRAN
jgi:hypothetical protein